jgi:triosephosphate isomerase (TIM)
VSKGSRPVVIAGNWKMHMTCSEARAFADQFLPLVANAPSDRSIVLAPAFTALETMHRAVAGSAVQLASQNVHWEGNGAFTGEISAKAMNRSTTAPGRPKPLGSYRFFALVKVMNNAAVVIQNG